MSFRIPLKPMTDQNKKPPPFAACDIEGSDWIKFLAISWYNGTDYEAFEKLGDFIDFVFDETDERVIFAHFGGIYDFLFILKEALEQRSCRIEGLIPRGSGLLCFDMIRDKKVKNHATGKFETKSKKITFKDSSALLPFSLKNITHSFNVKHKKMDFDVSNLKKMTPDAWKYLEHDTKGLWEALDAYYNWELIKRAGPAATMASQALKVFRLFMHTEIRSLKEPVDLFVRKGYFGGRTEIFRPEFNGIVKGKKKKKLYYYDVNSLYPDVMKNNEYPTNFRMWTMTYKPKEMGFYEAEVEVPTDMYLPPLPVVQEINGTEKLVFPVGRFQGVWSTIELEYAKSVGCKVHWTGKGALFQNGGHIFRDYIDTLYEMRMEAKENGDGVGDILTKLLMNSCYGRFGLNTDREQLLFDDFTTGLKLHSEIPIKRKGRDLKVRLMTKQVKLDKTFTNVAVAAWVTSLARIKMHKIMLPVQKELYYTDTDSLFTTKKLKTGDKIGELKDECVDDPLYKAVFLLPKTYVVEGSDDDNFKKLAMKGFDRKKIQHFKYEDFFCALEGDLRHMNATHDAKMAKFKTAAKKGDLLTLLPGHERQLKAEYDKRLVFRRGKSWDTKPLEIRL